MTLFRDPPQQTTDVPPQDRYSTLCNLASIYRRNGDAERALDLLQQAIEITETPRAATSGAERERNCEAYLGKGCHEEWHQIGIEERSQSRNRRRELTLSARVQVDRRMGLQGEMNACW